MGFLLAGSTRPIAVATDQWPTFGGGPAGQPESHLRIPGLILQEVYRRDVVVWVLVDHAWPVAPQRVSAFVVVELKAVPALPQPNPSDFRVIRAF
jgi:hypothetical protein